jgi:hypothetical protein
MAAGMDKGMVEGMAQGITAGMATGSNATFLANVERYI